MPLTPAQAVMQSLLGRQSEDHELKLNLGHTASSQPHWVRQPKKEKEEQERKIILGLEIQLDAGVLS